MKNNTYIYIFTLYPWLSHPLSLAFLHASTLQTPPPPAHSHGGRPPASTCACACAGVGGVCAPCLGRAAARAPRAGTQGFRPPEVLLKSPRQGTAVDTWAAGVVLASALARRYPLLRAPDDAAALAELVDLLGSAPLQRAAAALGEAFAFTTLRGCIQLNSEFSRFIF